MKITLKEIYTRLKATPIPRDYKTVILLELLPLIREAGPLKNAYVARIQYFERLAKDQKYLSLIQCIHEVMKDVHRLIDPLKFPKVSERLKTSERFMDPTTLDSRTLLSWHAPAVKIHSLLIQRDKWSILGHIEREYGTRDSLLCPWGIVLVQYSQVKNLIDYAINVEAAGKSTMRPYLNQMKGLLERLWEMLSGTSQRLHTREFEYFHIHTSDPTKLFVDESLQKFYKLRNATEVVLQDLLSVLDIVEAEEQSESPRIDTEAAAMMFPEWTGDQSISYDGKNLSIGEQKAKIPKEGDATNRQILLIKLVEDYNLGKSIGVDAVTFMQELRKVQIRPSTRALETAAKALSDEIEVAFKLCKFVRVSRSIARIIKSDK